MGKFLLGAALLVIMVLGSVAALTAPVQDRPSIIMIMAVVFGFSILVGAITRTMAGKR